MNDVFSYVIQPYLESKTKGWSPFELHIVPEHYEVGSFIDNETFISYRCLLKRELENGHTRYYDMSAEPGIEGALPSVQPRIMNLRNVYNSFAGISLFGNFEHTCYIIIINRYSKEVMECSGFMRPFGDRQLYMKQFANIFKKFDSMVVESNVEEIIKKRFLE